MKIRFQADADLNEDMVLGLTRLEHQIDFQTASEAGLRGLSDLDVLSCAARDNRILVSHDRRTMPRTSRLSSRPAQALESSSSVRTLACGQRSMSC
jgi:predicted nuclease of predicted toxin-antitoxin system